MSHRSAQPAGKHAQVRDGGGDASNGAYVVHARVPMHCVCDYQVMSMYLCAALD
jgi:hypothetical protein